MDVQIARIMSLAIRNLLQKPVTKILLVVYVRLLAWAQAPDDDEKKMRRKKMHCR